MMDNKKAPAPAATDAGAGAEAPKHKNIVTHPERDCNPTPGYWAVIPASVRYDKRLKPNAKLLYGEISALTRAEGYCWATNDYFAELYGLSKDNIGRLIAQLEELGYITREIVRDEETNAVTGRKIWILQPTGTAVNPPGKNADPSRQKCGDPPGKNVGENNININNIPPISPKGEEKAPDPTEALFENFWKLYPARKGRRNGKAQALKVWRGLKVNVRLYEAILAGLDAYVHSDEVQRGYAMDAARWLRGRRWEDEVVTTEDIGLPTSTGALPAEWAEDLPGGFWDG